VGTVAPVSSGSSKGQGQSRPPGSPSAREKATVWCWGKGRDLEVGEPPHAGMLGEAADPWA
jgi:hypothetical protein